MRNNYNRYLTVFLLFTAIQLTLVSCVRENRNGCASDIRIGFSYTQNKDKKDLLQSRVEFIDVFVFDKSDILCDIISCGVSELNNNNILKHALDAGTYTFVSWATGGGSATPTNSYMPFDTKGSGSSLRDVKVGETNLADFRMVVRSTPFPESDLAEVMPQESDIKNLFYATTASKVTVNPDGIVALDFIKNTNDIYVKVNGLDNLKGTSNIQFSDLDVFIVSSNGRYFYDNKIDSLAKRMLYPPITNTVDESKYTSEYLFRTQRMDLVGLAADPFWIYVRDSRRGTNIIPPVNLIESIVRLKDENGEYLYKSQSDLDIEDEYYINIYVSSDLTVRIVINGFVVQELTPDLD